MTEITKEQQDILDSLPTPPVHIALIIDNEVVDILHANERLGAILLSDPTIVDISDLDQNVALGASYNSETKQFTNPS